MVRRKAFTLIELLVVIAIIALVVSILMPSLARAKAMARAVVCQVNLHLWSVAIDLYCADNNSFYPVEMYSTDAWMHQVEPYYASAVNSRLCPSAKPTSPNFFGSTFFAWDVQPYYGKPLSGSYGLNLWINSLSPRYGASGWANRPAWQWQQVDKVTVASAVPSVVDCAWIGANCFDYASCQTGVDADGYALDYWQRMSGAVPPSETWNEQHPATVTGEWEWNFRRICMNRHMKAINVGFCDGSGRRVPLQELWSLTWHKRFRTTPTVKIPWLN